MQVTINGPPVSQCRDVVNRAVKSWLNEPRRKLPYKKSVATPQESTPVSHTVSVRDINVQTEDVEKRIQTESQATGSAASITPLSDILESMGIPENEKQSECDSDSDYDSGCEDY